MSGFLHVIYSILNASVILERNETRLKRGGKCLQRNQTHLTRNETSGGNLILHGTVCSEDFQSPNIFLEDTNYIYTR